jgi:exosortase
MSEGATLATKPDSRAVKPPDLPWASVAWFAALLAVCYGITFVRLVHQWTTDDDMSHGMFVPVLVLYIVWQRRQEIAALPPASSKWGLVGLLLGGFMLCIGPPSLPTFTFMTRVAFICSLLGLLLYLGGFPLIRKLAYPLFLLIFMIPLPGFVYQRLTFPLQFLASIVSENVLELLGFSVLREGNVLHLAGQTLSVAEACSGLRSLFSLSFLGQAYIYLFDDRAFMRGVIAVAIIPIAVVANSARIVSTAFAGRINPEWTHGTVHDWTGWVLFGVAFAILVGTHHLFNRLYSRFRSA